MTIILLLALLFTKHLVFDFIYQPPYQWQNKGTYGHLGGIIHTGQHVIASWCILLFFTTLPLCALLCATEALIHYHMDWFKMWYNKKKGWGATTHNEFWILTGIDQWVHAMTYILMVALLL
jgi:hypothetical protein